MLAGTNLIGISDRVPVITTGSVVNVLVESFSDIQAEAGDQHKTIEISASLIRTNSPFPDLILLRVSETQLTMLDAFVTQNLIADLANRAGFVLEDNDLETVVMVDVDVRCGDDASEVPVLKVCQFFLQLADVVVIDEREDTEGDRSRVADIFVDHLFPDEISDRFRAVCVASSPDQIVEFGKKPSFHGHTEPDQFIAPHVPPFFEL